MYPNLGVDDDQANAFARLPPLVAALAGSPRLSAAVVEMVTTTQRNSLAAGSGLAAARVLELCVLGKNTPAEAVRVAADAMGASPGSEALRLAISLQRESHADAVAELGRHCHLPASLASALHGVLTHTEYAAAVRDTILQGGCNASRAGFIGACFAASQGASAIPAAWCSQCASYERTAAQAAWVTAG